MTTLLRDPAGLLERAPELADLAWALPAVQQALERGDPHAVYRALWWARLRGKVQDRRPLVDALLARRRIFVKPLKHPPVLQTVNGLGATVYGSSERDADGSFVKTHFLVLVFVPVFPLSQYLVRDADKGWYFLGKVPLSTPMRLWHGAILLSLLLAVGFGVQQTIYASRHHDLYVVNGLPWGVHVQVGPEELDVAPRQQSRVVLSTGRHSLLVTTRERQTVESGQVEITAGSDALIWNVLGAGPVFDRTVIYTPSGSQAPEPAAAPVSVFCGQRWVRLPAPDDLFSDPPPTVSMSEHQTAAYRRHVGVAPAEFDYCVSEVMSRGVKEAERSLALGLAVFDDPEASATGLAAGLLQAAGDGPEAVRVTRAALAKHPDSVNHHRAFQSVAESEGLGEELRRTYGDRQRAAPDSADAAYLLARVLPGAEGLRLAEDYARRFPDHLFLRRLLIYRFQRSQRYADALASIERVNKVDRLAGREYLEEHVTALAALGRRDEALRLAEAAFAPNDAPRFQLAVWHAWLSAHGTPTSAAGAGTSAKESELIRRLQLDPAGARQLRARYWLALSPAEAAELARGPDAPLYRLMQQAHREPAAALAQVLRLPPGRLAELNPEVTVLLLGLARGTPGSQQAQERLTAALGPRVNLHALTDYLARGVWSERLEELTLSLHGALHLARSMEPGVPPPERRRLRELAGRCDPLGGYVHRALEAWPLT